MWGKFKVSCILNPVHFVYFFLFSFWKIVLLYNTIYAHSVTSQKKKAFSFQNISCIWFFLTALPRFKRMLNTEYHSQSTIPPLVSTCEYILQQHKTHRDCSHTCVFCNFPLGIIIYHVMSATLSLFSICTYVIYILKTYNNCIISLLLYVL